MRKIKNLFFSFRYHLIIGVFIALLACSAFLFATAQNPQTTPTINDTSFSKPTVILDAGHGGEDCGTIGVSGVYEKDLNFEITLKIGEYLSAAGYNVVYTRTEDKLLYKDTENVKGLRKISDLKNRVSIANQYDNAIFVSIHMNSYSSAKCKGFQAYFSDTANGSMSLANAIQSSVKNKLQSGNTRAVKNGGELYILENSKNPAVILECGFLSNPEECEKLSQKEYQKELSFAIICGIIEYNKNKS